MLDIYKQMGVNTEEDPPQFHNAGDRAPLCIRYYRLAGGRSYPLVLWYCKECGMTLQTRSTANAFWYTKCGLGTFRFELRFASRCLQAIRRMQIKAAQLQSNKELADKVKRHAEEAHQNMEHVIGQIQRRRKQIEARTKEAGCQRRP